MKVTLFARKRCDHHSDHLAGSSEPRFIPCTTVTEAARS